MMDLAPIVITALVLTIILQIVLIILVLDTKKKNKIDLKGKPLTAAATAPEMRDLKKPREHESRLDNRRPPSHDQKTKPSSVAAQNQNVDSVERSLRDINLRLKNAERDQEKERRRIKDALAAPPQKRSDFNKPRERNEGFRRNDRPRQDFTQQRPVELPKPVREERPDPDGGAEPKEVKTPPPTVVAPAFSLPPQTSVKPIDKAVDTIIEMDVSNSINKENLQHGRKIIVKRRVLKAEDEQTEGSGKDEDKLIDNKPSDTTPIPLISPAQTPSENAQEAKTFH